MATQRVISAREVTRKPGAAIADYYQPYTNSGWRPILYLKSCPRCYGDMYQEKDNYGAYIKCVQCGFTCDLPEGKAAAVHVEQSSCWEKLRLTKAA